ncbi:hypothetical protein GCM10022261_07810 [Brevibacterium daeguense]|uniref:DUF2877 domain-containing protein n=1 Tax=Brevibacterium daeguense TaxID=909936 RepID=A0ABP8EH22_9MICO
MLSPPPLRPAAASVLAPDWLHRSGEATVLAALPRAVYLHAGEWSEVLCVLDADALRLPNSVVVPSVGIGTGRPVSTGLIPGDAVTVSAGRIELPSARLEVRRTFRPASIRVGAAVGIDGEAVRALRAELRPGLPGLADAAADVLAALDTPGSTDGLAASTRALVGRGPGLTPSGDDVLAGVLLGLRAAGRIRASATLAEAVAAHLRATTSLSASLLRAAGDGWCLPEVRALLDGLRSGGAVPGSTTSGSPVAHSLKLLDRIGHSSGHDLATGLLAVLTADRGRPSTASAPIRSAHHRERTLHA